jgi:ketosteroid isomerase-like protein
MALNHVPDPADLVSGYLATFARRSGVLLDRHYEPDAVLVPRPGLRLTGAQRVAAHDHLLGFGVPMRATPRHTYVSGDIALLIVDWSLRGTTRAGEPVDLSGTATDVARRGADGQWRYVIDNPFGSG